MGHFGNAALATWSLAIADTLTGHVASTNVWEGINGVVENISGNVGGIVSWGAANTNVPILGSAAPFASVATGGYALWRWYQKTKEHGIIRWVQEGSLAFGTISGIGALTGLMATSSLTSPLLATGLGIYWARKAYGLGKTFFEKPGENLTYAAKQPFKWSANALKKLWKWKGTPAS